MKKFKLDVIIGISFIISLGTAYLIGQYVVKPNEVNNNNAIIEESEETKSGIYDESEYSFINNFDNLTFSGLMETGDNPWGQTIAKFDMDGAGDRILLTPNTSITANVDITKDVLKLSMGAMIHPWVQDKSDGAVLCVKIYQESIDNLLMEESYDISNVSDYKNIEIDLSQFIDQSVNINISCKSGENEDCDWIVLKDTKISNDEVTTSSESGSMLQESEYLISAHFFSDEWSVNFWNSEMSNIDSELQQIVDDGFNSIIIVVPWREFQPIVEPITYNNYALQKLDFVMEKAAEKNLKVLARVGYTWDYFSDADGESATKRFKDIMVDGGSKTAWLDYVSTIYGELSKFDNFAGAFITWEDFWNTIYDAKNMGKSDESINMAKLCGYQDYLEENYKLIELNSLFGEKFEDYSQIYIPDGKNPAFETFYSFYDEFLEKLLLESQEVAPNLSMEVRVDYDGYYSADEELNYYKHDETYDCGNSDYTTIMYGIPMGFENKGERVDFETAISKTTSILDNVRSVTNNKKLYVDQFIFADNSPGYENNAQIVESQMNDYLVNIAGVLKEKTCGYGIWTYRNYVSNMLYNAQFGLNLDGWEVDGIINVNNVSNSNVICMNEGSEIVQEVPETRNPLPGAPIEFTVDVISNEPGNIEVTVGNQTENISFDHAGQYNITFNNEESYDLEIKSNGYVELDNIKLYTYCLNGFLYDNHNNELECISGIRELNSKLN